MNQSRFGNTKAKKGKPDIAGSLDFIIVVEFRK